MNERVTVEMLPNGQRVHMAIHVPASSWRKCGETHEAFENDYAVQVPDSSPRNLRLILDSCRISVSTSRNGFT